MTGEPPVVTQIARGGQSDMDWLQAADYLWLAQWKDRAFVATQPVEERPEEEEANQPPSNSPLREDHHPGAPPPPPAEGLEPAMSTPQASPPVTLSHPGPAGDARQQRANVLRVYKPLSLPDAREIMRALRPLHRRVPFGAACDLDVEASVEQTAEAGGVFRPVLRAAERRWLALDLVVDASRSMEFWTDLPQDLETLLVESGVFREVRRWHMDTRTGSAVLTNPSGGVRHPDTIGVVGDRRAMLVVTDTIGRAWHSLAAFRQLEKWGRRAPVTVMHLLSPEQWPHTALWQTDTARISSRVSLPVNASRALSAEFPLTLQPPEKVVPFACLSMDGGGFSRWAGLMAARGGNLARGFQLWQTAASVGDNEDLEPIATAQAKPEDAGRSVQEFLRRTASPLAIELATHLAAVPLVPAVMRLIQEAFLPESRHWHLAAVLFSGLTRRSRYARGRVWYEWQPGVQRQLLALGSSRTHVQIWQKAAAYLLEHEPGYRALQALYPHPEGPISADLSDESCYFAQFDAELFQTWQGEWRERGSHLARRLPIGRAVITMPALGFGGIGGRYFPTAAVMEGYLCQGGRAVGMKEGVRIFESTIEKLYPYTAEESLSQWIEAELEGSAPPSIASVSAGQVCLVELQPDSTFDLHGELICWAPEQAQAPKKPRLAYLCDDAYEHMNWRHSGLHEFLSEHFELDDSIWYRVTTDLGAYDAALLLVVPKPMSVAEDSPRAALLRERLKRRFPACLLSREAVDVPETALGLPCPLNLSAAEGISVNDRARILAAFGVLQRHTLEPFGINLVHCPAGSFTMGCPENEPGSRNDERPKHLVTLRQSFWLAETPVTQRQWRQVVEAGVLRGIDAARDLENEPGLQPSFFKNRGEEAPVENVSWHHVQAWLAVLNAITSHERKAGAVLNEVEFSLPTEAEWEYACRAGSCSPLYSGDITIRGKQASELDLIAWYIKNAGNTTRRVAEKRENDWGFHDMIGNVWEWCFDSWRIYTSENQDDPMLTDASLVAPTRAIRGGSWVNRPNDCRSASRNQCVTDLMRQDIGFRVAAVSVDSRIFRNAETEKASQPFGESHVPPPRDQTPINSSDSLNAMKTRLRLTPQEVAHIFRTPPSDKHKGGFQGFMVKLQSQANQETGEIELTREDIARIRRQGTTGSGGYQSRMRAIFGRLLGKKLDGPVDGK